MSSFRHLKIFNSYLLIHFVWIFFCFCFEATPIDFLEFILALCSGVTLSGTLGSMYYARNQTGVGRVQDLNPWLCVLPPIHKLNFLEIGTLLTVLGACS